MVDNMEESFLITASWNRVKERMQNHLSENRIMNQARGYFVPISDEKLVLKNKER